MKKLVIAAGMAFCLMGPSFAFALDKLVDPDLGMDVVKPREMTCRQFEKGSADLQLFVSAWYDGDSTDGIPSEVEYSKADVLSMQKSLFRDCKDDPNATLEELEFSYGVGGDFRDPTCSFLLGIKDQRDAWTFLSWGLGFFAQERRVSTIDMDDFVEMGNSLIQTCKSSPRANVMEEMQSYLNVGRRGMSSPSGSSSGMDGWEKNIENI